MPSGLSSVRNCSEQWFNANLIRELEPIDHFRQAFILQLSSYHLELELTASRFIAGMDESGCCIHACPDFYYHVF